MNWSGNFREGLAREIRENKTLAKITAYTVILSILILNHTIKCKEKGTHHYNGRLIEWYKQMTQRKSYQRCQNNYFNSINSVALRSGMGLILNSYTLLNSSPNWDQISLRQVLEGLYFNGVDAQKVCLSWQMAVKRLIKSLASHFMWVWAEEPPLQTWGERQNIEQLSTSLILMFNVIMTNVSFVFNF